MGFHLPLAMQALKKLSYVFPWYKLPLTARFQVNGGFWKPLLKEHVSCHLEQDNFTCSNQSGLGLDFFIQSAANANQ